MKQGTPLISFVMIVIAVALSVYFGFYVFHTFNDPFSTTLAYSYTVYDSVEADGVLTRKEQVLPSHSGIVDLTRSEGEKVGVGQTVALVYADTRAQSDQAQLETLKLEIDLLEYAAADGGGVESAARLDEDILQSVVALRSAAARGDYSALEEQVRSVKSSVLKRGYTYGENLTAGDLSLRLTQLKQEYSALNRQSSAATTRVRAEQSGVFSTLVDGYEQVLTPTTVFQLTPTTLTQLMAGGTGTNAGGLGKLITGYRWYFAATLPGEIIDRLHEGKTAHLRFSGDFTQDVQMQVEQLGQLENGQAVAVFSSDRYLSRTTLLRQQTAELIFDSWSGLRLPKQALHMVKFTQKDAETGAQTELSRLGVYVLLGGRAEFKAVEVITEGTDFYVVAPTNQDSHALRAGDEVITHGIGLYDGQLLEF